jgi:tetratricopeptide (TPR) repeat protein
VDQVIAHEIGHVKHRHLLLYLLFFIGFMLISYTVYPVSVWIVFSKESVISVLEAFRFNPKKLSEIFFGISLVICTIIYFRFIFGYFIRNFERQADTYVFRLFPSARPLISTFDKIVASSGQPADKPNWHHFSIQQRVEYLWRCEESPRWISRHHRKVKNSIAVFIACVLLLGAASFHLNRLVFDKGREYFNIAVVEAYLEQKNEKTREDALLYLVVGNFHFDKTNHNRALAAYEASLKLDADNPETLNNLAWLLVTSDDGKVRDPARALALAQRAVDLLKAPHIWDTLAECLYANSRFQEAVEAEKRALEMKPDDTKLYLDQLAKFEKALKTASKAGDD